MIRGVRFIRAQGPLEFDSLRNNVILECEKTEEKLTNSWLPGIINIFADKSTFTGVHSSKADSFYNCVSTLISNQVSHMTASTLNRSSRMLVCLYFQIKSLLTRTIEAWVDLFDEGNIKHLPIVKMELVYDDNLMQFYPPCVELEELIQNVVETIGNTLQSVRTC